ncbi:MAG: arsenic transporter [Janthinobacterium lividum]
MSFDLRLCLTLAVFAATMVCILTRPWGRHEAWWAAGGGALMLIGGLETPKQAWQVTRTGQDALLFLLSLLILSALLERSGFFEWASVQAARLANGSGNRLYRNVFVLGALITATLSLDTTAVILTPVVLAFVSRLKLPPRPYIFACAFVANNASLPLPVSNLTNLLFTGAFGLPFAGFFLRMALPQIVALLLNYALFRRLFRSELPVKFSSEALPDAKSLVPDQGYFRAAIWVLGLVLVGYFAAPFVHIPPYAVGFAGCVGLSIFGIKSRRVDLGLAREISWPVFPFVVGLFVVIGGVENLGLTDRIALSLSLLNKHPLLGLLAVSGGAGAASNIVNNIPAALLARSVLEQAHSGTPLVYGTLLGTNIGPNITLSGSLATLLVLTAARKKGEDIGALSFLKIGLLVTPLVLLAATLTLWLTFRLVP